jgi:hypothetical protein
LEPVIKANQRLVKAAAKQGGEAEWGLYYTITRGIMQQDPTRKAANKIAPGLYSLEREPVIKANQRLVEANQHDMVDAWSYDAFKAWGPHSRKSGFSAENVFCIAFILTQRLQSHIDDKWRSIDNFGFQSLDKFMKTNLTTTRLNMSFRDPEEKDELKFDDKKTKDIREQQ